MSVQEHSFDEKTILVSKTDLQGHITYANQNFIKISGFSEKELIGKPHNIVRHPQMPAVVFKLLWNNLKNGEEINAYVINSTKDGGFYWVLANVTPSFNSEGKVIGYHSARRKPTKEALNVIKPLYNELLQIEKSSGIDASQKRLNEILQEKGCDYDEFVFSI